MKKRYISYLRVSTARQGASGLGIEAQRAAVRQFVDPSTAEILQEFIETESGRRHERLALSEALKACRIMSATLVVAKVDRLTRSASFLHQLLDSGVDIEFCDLPAVTGPTGRFLLNQMAAVAELETAMISDRTKAALAAAKLRGVKLGTPGNLPPEAKFRGAIKSAELRREKASQFAQDLLPLITNLRGEGMSLRSIARQLNAMGISTPRNCGWTAVQVSRVLSY